VKGGIVTEYFDKVRGGCTLYYGSEGVNDVRFVLMHFGEDPSRVIEAFWSEKKGGDFVVTPIVAYGAPPRRDLCTQKSLVSALQTATIPLGGVEEARWRGVCEFHAVQWPRRLQEKAA
jgi:hypothetical protein